jgi:gas vesicle protein
VAQDPELIRRDIEETRHHMGDTVDALAYKADVPGRAKDRVSGAVGSVKDKLGGAGSAVADRTPDGAQMKEGAMQAVGVAEANPLGLAVGFAAAGFLAGMVAPKTRIEDERIGPMADQVKEQVRDTGTEALERGKQVASDVADTAKEQAQQAASEVKDTTRESAQQQGSELKDSAQESAQSVRR